MSCGCPLTRLRGESEADWQQCARCVEPRRIWTADEMRARVLAMLDEREIVTRLDVFREFVGGDPERIDAMIASLWAKRLVARVRDADGSPIKGAMQKRSSKCLTLSSARKEAATVARPPPVRESLITSRPTRLASSSSASRSPGTVLRQLLLPWG